MMRELRDSGATQSQVVAQFVKWRDGNWRHATATDSLGGTRPAGVSAALRGRSNQGVIDMAVPFEIVRFLDQQPASTGAQLAEAADRFLAQMADRLK